MTEKKSKNNIKGNFPAVKQEEERTFPVVGIGASAGGLEALEKIFIPSARGLSRWSRMPGYTQRASWTQCRNLFLYWIKI